MYICVAMGACVAGWLIPKWKALSAPERISWLFIVVLAVHIFEEYTCPGGFVWAFGTAAGSTNPLSAPLNRLTTMITNVGAMVVFIMLAWKWANRPWMLIAIAIFDLLQLIMHTAFGVISMQYCSWLHVPYSPGLANSVLMMLPLAIACIVVLRREHMLRGHGGKFVVGQILLGLVVDIVVVVALIAVPVNLLGNDVNSPYAFPDAGFYQRELE